MNRAAILRMSLLLCATSGMTYAQIGRPPHVSVSVAAQGVTREGPTREMPLAPVAPQLTPEQLPPVEPEVTCRGGQVTVRAENSTLASVLHSVAACTHTSMELPVSVGSIRVAVVLGPLSQRDTFVALLDGALDYILVGTSQNPERVRRVIIKAQQTGAPGVATVQNPAISEQKPETYIDQDGVERLMSGLTPEESRLSPEELALKFQAAREQQQREEELSRSSEQK